MQLFGASGKSIFVEAIGTSPIELPSSKILELEECYYMPKIIRNIISIPMLLKHDFEINLWAMVASYFFLMSSMAMNI